MANWFIFRTEGLVWKKKTVIPVYEGQMTAARRSLGNLSNHVDDGNENVTNLHIWRRKIIVLHALHVHSSFFHISQTFSFFLRREMICFAVVWTTLAHHNKCSILSSYAPGACSNLIPWQLQHIFLSIMTLNNWKMIAETRSNIFRWRRVCLSSLISFNTYASFEFQKMWTGPQNMLHFLDRTPMIKYLKSHNNNFICLIVFFFFVTLCRTVLKSERTARRLKEDRLFWAGVQGLNFHSK